MARKTYEIAFELAGKIGSSFSGMFTSASNRLAQVNRQISTLQRETKTLDRSLKDGKITAEEYARAYAKVENQLKQAEQAQQRFTRAAKAEQLAQKSDQFRGQMQGAMMGAAGAAVAIGAPVYAAMQFESSMADVRKVVDFDTPQQFKAMEKDILSLSKRIPMAAEGLAQIVASGGQAGLAREELLAYAEAAAKMGVAFDITAEEAGQTMAQWRSAFKMNQEQVNVLADQINYLGNTTAASAPKISDVVRRIGPLGEVGGAAANQIAAMGATMVGAGVGEEIAATGIKNLILSLTAGEAATKKQAEALQMLGMDAEQMASMMQKDAQGAIMSVFAALQKLPKEKQASVLSELFGKESIGAIAPLLTNLDALETNLRNVADTTKYAGSMEKEFEARSATTANNLQLLQNNVKALGISIGNILLPAVNKGAEKLVAIAEKVEAFTQKHPTLTKALILGAAALTIFTFGVAGLGLAFSLVVSPLARFYAWATKISLSSKVAAVGTKAWAAAQRLLNIAMSMNPIMRVVLLIGGLIFIGKKLYDNFESIRNIVDGVWAAFKEKFPSAAKFVEGVFQKVGKLWDKLKGFWRWLGGKGDSGGSSSTSSNAGNLRALDRYATGGFASRPSIFGDAGLEAAIPIDGSARSRSIWERAGELSGFISGDSITYAPVIHAPGGDPGVIKQVLKESRDDFFDKYQAMKHQQRRLAYA